MAHILVVEDNPMNMELVVDLLESYGYEVTGSQESARALDLVKEMIFDLILLDMQLPEMDGLELLEKFREDLDTAKIPVVAVTAHVMKGDEERFIRAGCIGYIPKPIDVHQFKSIVAGYLEK